MTYATNLATRVSTSPLNYSPRAQAGARQKAVNVGYLLFAFGVLWVIAVAAAMLGVSGALPRCEFTETGDIAICGASASVETPASVSRSGLNVSGMTIPAGLSGSGYDAF